MTRRTIQPPSFQFISTLHIDPKAWLRYLRARKKRGQV
jgi:hypothetical protein